MRRPLPRLLLAFAAAGALACPASAAAEAGSFSALTYNVAGLPEGLSSGTPARNTGLIGQRTGAFDLVHVQEDFNYHGALYGSDTHAYRTTTSGAIPFGSGLNTMSWMPYSGLRRVKWSHCWGFDCWTPKGFTLMRLTLAPGRVLDVYNLHANAGVSYQDVAARRANIAQLSKYVAGTSAANAVLIMGDTNTRYTRAGDNIRTLVQQNGLTDAWVQSQRAGSPPAAGAPALVCDKAAVTSACEVVDKILYRSGPALTLTLDRYANEHAAFVDSAGRALSDHYPIGARFSWSG